MLRLAATMVAVGALGCLLAPVSGVELEYMSFWQYDAKGFSGGWTNFAFIADVGVIVESNQLYGTRFLLDVLAVFFVAQTVSPTEHPYTLREDYAARWESQLPVARQLYANNTIFGFFMGDELVWNGLEPAMLDTAAKMVRASFPSAIIWTNGATPPMVSGVDVYGHPHNYTHISSALSWFSIDMYHVTPDPTVPNFALSVKSFYEKYVFPKMDLNFQHGVLVPGSFGSHNNSDCDVACYDQMCARDAHDFYDWAHSDERIVAIAPWHWLPCSTCGRFRDEIGTQNMTLARAAWNDIGHKIVNTRK